ncbi:transglutaminase TgpA family protein [Streptomyces oceani]|uniref:Transglutaminase n=1 Tax=Streptomyces oceani TaxID=1075402 RepID=A0A1E7KCI2_9ACTN|nr:DUF3488 and transglutaminase-like domain-containing protein [Streptomyces oceani]OEV01652.1 transglutaminase [Streptomyces oceani]
MSGQGRLSVCAGVATIAAASALLPLVTPATWLLEVTLLILVQTCVGAAARRVPLPRPLTVAIQAVVSLLLLTAFFVSEHALAGVLPTPDAFRALGELMETGSQDVGRFAVPAPATEGIRLMLVGGVLVVALLVDVVAVTYRSAAPAGLPLLALYSVAAGLGEGGGRWLWFLCAAAGYLLLLLAEGRERLSQWGQIFENHARGTPAPAGKRRPYRPGGAAASVRTGRRIGALALGIALAVPAALPSLGGGLLDSLTPSDSGRSGDSTVSAVNPVVALQDSLNQPENRTVLTYRTNSPAPDEMYLRIVALDQFDGSSWKPSERRITEVPEQLPAPAGLDRDVRTRTVRTTVKAAEDYAQNWLPMPFPASRVKIDGRWRFEPEGRTLVGDRGQTTRGKRYEVESLVVQPTATQLKQAGAAPREIREEYTQVPDSLPSEVHKQAQRITSAAKTDYERAMALQEWFTQDGGFTYDTQVRAGSGSAAIVRFLQQKEGFCVHFAFSMAAMARTLDIPARVAVGFTPGTAGSDGRTSVGLRDAHAWPELYFEGVGWTRFEPTPTRGSTPDYALPDAPEQNRDDPGEPTQRPTPEPSEEPSAQPTPSQECTVEQKRADPECGQIAAPPGRGPGDGSGFPLGSVLLAGVGVVTVLGVPLLPLLWRTRVRSRRLRGDADALAGWRELLDIGWDYGIVPDESATPRTAVARLVRDGGLDPAATEAARRVASAVEQVLFAPVPEPADGLGRDVRRVREALGAASTRGARLRALLLPRSAVRVKWAAAERWARISGRCRSALRPRVAK